MAETLDSALLFLINTVFSLYLFVLIVRFLLVFVGANYFDPITQFIIKLTNFIVKPLRKVVPNIKRVETSTLLLIIVLEVIKFFLISILSFGLPNIGGLLILALSDGLKLFIETFFYAILLQAILSWIQPYSPINKTLYQITSPLMDPIRRVVPLVGGVDISPIPALILLQLLLILLINPFMKLGLSIALG